MTPADFSLTLLVDNGSLPPRYRKSSRTTLDAAGLLRDTRKAGYDGDGETTERTLDAATLADLIRDLRRLGLFSTAWIKREHRTVGGGRWHLRVTADGEQSEIPWMLHPDQVEARDQIRDRLRKDIAPRPPAAGHPPPAPPGDEVW